MRKAEEVQCSEINLPNTFHYNLFCLKSFSGQFLQAFCLVLLTLNQNRYTFVK